LNPDPIRIRIHSTVKKQDRTALKNTIFSLFFSGFDEMSITDLYEGSKSRQSSGFSEGEKSRNCSGLGGDGGKSRNCSGNSISQGLVSSGFLSSNPVNIPGTDTFGIDR
jgi:hypothetical protein